MVRNTCRPDVPIAIITPNSRMRSNADIRMGFITPDQLKSALAKQDQENRSNRHRLLGLILFDEGWLTTTQIESVLQGIFLQPERPEDRVDVYPRG